LGGKREKERASSRKKLHRPSMEAINLQKITVIYGTVLALNKASSSESSSFTASALNKLSSSSSFLLLLLLLLLLPLLPFLFLSVVC